MSGIIGRVGLATALALVLASGCTPKTVCIPGETRACLGAGQCAGAQSCVEAGTGFSACDCGAGGGTGGGSGQDAGSSVVLKGAAQKGPFIIGSTVSVSALGAEGLQTGQVFMSQTNNDRGEFQLTVPPLNIPFVEIEASGFHFNEVTGALSAAELTLRSIAPLDGSPTYVNVLTHLASNRIRTLAASGSDLALARATAEQELRAALPIGAPAVGVAASQLNLLGGDTDANAYLFAVSVVFAQAALAANPGAVDAELQQLLNTAALDFADGAFDPTLLARLEIAEELVDVGRVEASFDRRLAEIGAAAVAPDLDRVIDSDGDGSTNAADPCPLQAGNVPSSQFCLHGVAHLGLSSAFGSELVAGANGAAVVIGSTGSPDGGLSMQWLNLDGGVEPATAIRMADGGQLRSLGPLIASRTLDGSGEVIVGLLDIVGGCISVAFVSPAGARRLEQLACGAIEAPRVFQSPNGAMYAVWRGSTPVNSWWYSWSSGAGFGAPALLCTECGAVFAPSLRGEVALSYSDFSTPVPGGPWLRRTDGDGGWGGSSVAPYTYASSLTFDSRGTVGALWTTSSSELSWVTHDGTAWSATSSISSQVETWTALAGNAGGFAIAGFARQGPDGGEVLGTVLPADGGTWAPPRFLGSTRFVGQALLSERVGAVSWFIAPQLSVSIARYDLTNGWGASQDLPRVSGEAQFTFVNESTVRIVWRPLDGGISTALLR